MRHKQLLMQHTLKNGARFCVEYVDTGPETRCVHTWGDEGIYDHTLVYDLEARRTVVTNSLGYSTTYFGNENGLVAESHDARGGVTVTEYNEFNEVVREADALGHTTVYEYDERGNCLLTTEPDGAALQRAYDERDQLLTLTNAIDGQWQWTYDEAGNQLTKTDPLGLTERYEYTNGLLSRRAGAGSQATVFLRDKAGNLLEVRDGDEPQRQRWLYNGWGWPYKFIDERGNEQWRKYDLLNRVISVHEPDGNVRSFAYDALNNLIRSKDRHHDVHYTYRGLSRLIRRVEVGTAVEFLHDTEEQLRAIVNEHGLAYRFELDGGGEVITETGFDGLTRRYERDAGGRVLHVEAPDGQRTRYTYDQVNRLTQVAYNNGSAELFAYRADGALLAAANETIAVTFERDIVGNVLQEIQGTYTVWSSYDAAGRREEVTSSLGACVRYTRDHTGRVAQVTAGSWQARIDRDAQGLELQRMLSGGVRSQWRHNLLGLPTEQRISTGQGQPDKTRTHHWQENERLTQIEDSQSEPTRFMHDAVGNLTATLFGDGQLQLRQPNPVGNLFATPDRRDRRYGPAGQLLEARGLRYTYDATGNLTIKTTPTGQVCFLLMDQLLAQIDRVVSLNDAEQRAFCAIAVPRHLRKHELLLRAGEVCRTITFVQSGCLRLFYNADGVENTVQFFCENTWHTDFLSYLTGQPTIENTQALEPCDVIQFSRVELEQLYLRYPSFERLGRISAENAFVSLAARNTMLTNQTPEARYRQLCHDRPELLRRVPQYHIASFLGIKPETLSRIRRRLAAPA